MNEKPFIKPVLFAVFLIISAGMLYSTLLRPLLGFKAPGQQPPIVQATHASTERLSATPVLSQRFETTEPIVPPLVIHQSLPEFNPAEASTPLIVEASEPDENIFPLSESTAMNSVTEISTVVAPVVMPEPIDSKSALGRYPATKSAVKVDGGKEKMLAEQIVKTPAVGIETKSKARPAPLSEASKQYLNKMNRLLDQELDN